MKTRSWGVLAGRWLPVAVAACGLCSARPASAAEAEVKLTLESGVREGVCRMTIQDVKGGYTIPYIQSARDLTIHIQWHGEAESTSIALLKGNQEVIGKEARRPAETVTFERLAPGEYDIRARWRNRAGAEIGRTLLRHVGIGTVSAAIGDSITEGANGRAFWQDNLNLKADMFPPDAVSKDGRNFPQFGPTTGVYQWKVMEVHRQKVNCLRAAPLSPSYHRAGPDRGGDARPAGKTHGTYPEGRREHHRGGGNNRASSGKGGFCGIETAKHHWEIATPEKKEKRLRSL